MIIHFGLIAGLAFIFILIGLLAGKNERRWHAEDEARRRERDRRRRLFKELASDGKAWWWTGGRS